MNCVVDSLDHLVLTVRDIDAAVSFYVRTLRMREIRFDDRVAVGFGEQKINLHLAGAEIQPHAVVPTPGSADLCFLSQTPVDDWIRHLESLGIPIELGPVPRIGAVSGLISIYLRDPDGNLVEISNRVCP
jgi:catechol 2,3-dioxygenase-like lactoylglutathione lyase family enzyme